MGSCQVLNISANLMNAHKDILHNLSTKNRKQEMELEWELVVTPCTTRSAILDELCIILLGSFQWAHILTISCFPLSLSLSPSHVWWWCTTNAMKTWSTYPTGIYFRKWCIRYYVAYSISLTTTIWKWSRIKPLYSKHVHMISNTYYFSSMPLGHVEG